VCGEVSFPLAILIYLKVQIYIYLILYGTNIVKWIEDGLSIKWKKMAIIDTNCFFRKLCRKQNGFW